jgi:hypothetical protein
MIVAPLAHAGHWIASALYLVPLVIVVAMLGISSLRDRRAAAAEAATPAPSPEAPADEQAAP